jgi:hypothetical protein
MHTIYDYRMILYETLYDMAFFMAYDFIYEIRMLFAYEIPYEMAAVHIFLRLTIS